MLDVQQSTAEPNNLSLTGTIQVMRQLISRYVAVLWLMAALSLIGWLFVNLDTAGWILVVLTVGLMAWELTTRKTKRGASGPGGPDQPSSP